MAVPLNRVRQDLRVFLAIVGLLTLIGLIFIYSSSSVFALEKFGAAHYFLKKQLIYFGLALVCFFVFAATSLEWWQRMSPYLFLGALFLTALTLVPGFGLRVHGSNRWLSFAGFSLQPSEFLKVFLFMYIGFFLEKKQYAITSFLHGYLPFLTVLGISFVVLLKQPDFGSVVTIFVTAIVIFFIANFKTIHMLVTLALTLPAGIFLIFSKSYRLNRILIFLNPWSDPQGQGFQIIQSLIAIGSGQLLGLGISNSKQKFFYLPMQHTDFIFPIIAEETGFVGSCIVIALYFLFLFYGLRLVLRFDRPFAFFTGLGFVVFITLQAVVNLMVTSGLLPTKGLGLPFISYGGTAIMSLLAMIGLMVNFARNSRVTS
jgi:cell division protein FtsW